jgi:sialic acid synthase SpsE
MTPRDTPAMTIGGRRIATDLPPFVIAEIGINHGGDIGRALALVDAAARAGASAIKLQTIVAAELVAPGCPPPAHVDAASLVEFFRRFELDEAAHRAVVGHARTHGLRVLSTPFSERAVDMLERVGVDGYKIASGDLTWDSLIARCAATGRPLVLSTGMATLAEARMALEVARGAGARDLALLHCVSAYPVPRGSENLLAIRTLIDACGVPVGLSDHADDAFALPLAVALGASLYERHLVLDGDAAGDAVDLAVSSTPADLERAIAAARRAWLALGSGRKACLAAEAVNVTASRRSLCAARDLPAGTIVAPADLVALRPATGLAPSALGAICGLQLQRSARRGEPILPAHFDTFAIPESGRVA